MSTTYLNWLDKYYFYTGAGVEGDVALEIGGHETAFFADLVVSLLFEKTADMFDETLYRGIYRDDGMAVFDKRLSSRDARD